MHATPFADITNVDHVRGRGKLVVTDIEATPRHSMGSAYAMSPEVWTPQSVRQSVSPTGSLVYVRQNDPYGWRAIPSDEEAEVIMRTQIIARSVSRIAPLPNLGLPASALPLLQQHAAMALTQLLRLHHAVPQVQPKPVVSAPQVPEFTQERHESRREVSQDTTPPAPEGPVICHILVQFKCHQGEYSSTTDLLKGQYIVVQGDRGIDIGVVNRVNTGENKSYVERTGPVGSIIRHATAHEVDYWATELKNDETAALEFCRQRVIRNHLPMEVRHAEYQFDKNKLTFYYEAKTRVDFVTLLKELYRQFACRIWMEKVRPHE